MKLQELYLPTQITLNWKPRFNSLRSICDVMLSKPTWLRGYTDCWGACLSMVAIYCDKFRRNQRWILGTLGLNNFSSVVISEDSGREGGYSPPQNKVSRCSKRRRSELGSFENRDLIPCSSLRKAFKIAESILDCVRVEQTIESFSKLATQESSFHCRQSPWRPFTLQRRRFYPASSPDSPHQLSPKLRDLPHYIHGSSHIRYCLL